MNSNDYLNINLTGSKKNVTFVFREQSISPSDKEMKKNVNLYTNYTLKKQFIDFLLSNPTFSRYREASFYLNRNNTITKLNPEKTVSRLGIGNFDTIIISFYEPNDERNQEQQGDNSDRININLQITQAEIIKEPLTLTRKKNWKKYLIIGSIILIISIFLIVYFLWPSPPKPPIFTKEKLKVNKVYPVNRLFIFNSQQVNEIKIEGEIVSKNNSYHNFNKTNDFIFITRNAYVEKDEDNLVEKEWYTGYIAIYHLKIPNTTNTTNATNTNNNIIIYSQDITNFLNISIEKSNERETYVEYNESNYCFIKIDFYRNGNVKNIYLPKSFSLDYYSYIEEIIKLLIPKISDNLFIDSIDDAVEEFNEINKREEKDNDTDIYNNTFSEEEKEEEEDSEKDLRNLKFKRKKKYLNSKYFKKRLSNDDNNNNETQINNSEISYTTEEYILSPLSKSVDYDFRQAATINNSTYDNTTNTTLNNNNYTNLTELSIKSIETDEVRMEGGLVNTTIYSLITK